MSRPSSRMHGFTLTLAQEVGPDNIRVNCICPGATEGDRIERVINAFVGSSERSYEEVRTRLESRASLTPDGHAGGGSAVRRVLRV